ncbi:MAG: DUF433 domain-containing protein [Acidobacteria bacterium]|nr:DUF433 domain-containing protein [Acidobacteriota bacterium]
MIIVDAVQQVPLTVLANGAIRITGSRVSLDSVLYHFNLGATPEQIAHKFPSLRLSDIYATITYYLTHRQPIDEYLRQQEKKADEVQASIDANTQHQTARTDLRERLLARQREQQTT